MLRLSEYQSREALKRFNVKLSEAYLAFTPNEAADAFKALGCTLGSLRAQEKNYPIYSIGGTRELALKLLNEGNKCFIIEEQKLLKSKPGKNEAIENFIQTVKPIECSYEETVDGLVRNPVITFDKHVLHPLISSLRDPGTMKETELRWMANGCDYFDNGADRVIVFNSFSSIGEIDHNVNYLNIKENDLDAMMRVVLDGGVKEYAVRVRY